MLKNPTMTPLVMNGKPKTSGVSAISLGRLQCIRRDYADPTDRQTEEEEAKAYAAEKMWVGSHLFRSIHIKSGA
jgi:hypothetical protein